MGLDLNALHAAADELLEQRGVLDIDRYGWLDMEDLDPDYLGYVMWVQVPPYDHDVMHWQHNIPPTVAPTAQEQALMEHGDDFFGFMKAARYLIGQTLLHQPGVRPFDIVSTEFDFNEFALLVAIIAASDRLRDFLITAVRGRKKRNKEKNQLEAAFVELEAAGFTTFVTKLRAGFVAADAARDARNEAVHGLATKPARVQRELISRDRDAYEAQSWGKPERGTYEERLAAHARREEEERVAIQARAQLLCATYIALIDLGDTSIRTEYFFRKRGGFHSR
jgi:hypothetical protein